MSKRHRLWVGAAALLLAAASGGCGGGVRFVDRPPVWRVDDARHIAEPEEIGFSIIQTMADVFVMRRLERALTLPDLEPAHNTNSLDEVPDSSWFTNRIGVRRMTAQEAARGPANDGPPKPPMTVIKGKSGGGNPGFLVEDASGRRFLIKFDTKENPELQTGTNAVVARILWAAGYNVPSDHVFYLRPEQLSIDPEASYKDALLDKHRYTRKQLDEVFRAVPSEPDGSYRATSSEFLPGIPKGGFPAEGVRDDDANDTVPHEHRRELRGLRAIAAWVNHTDMKEDNTLDMYVEDGKRSYLRHYLVDFGEAFGGHAAEKGRNEDGYEYFVDVQQNGKAMFAFGLWKRDWENLRPTRWLSVGNFTHQYFDPRGWHEAYPYWPFMEADAADHYWGAKIVMRFGRPHLEAIVATGKFTEPGAAAYLVWTRSAVRHRPQRAPPPGRAWRYRTNRRR
jgi:hypothetical protein